MKEMELYRITHRQLFCQVFMSMLSPVGIFLVGNGYLEGGNGLIAVWVGTLFLAAAVFFFVRFGNLLERFPLLGFWGTMPYILFSGAYLLHTLTEEILQYDQIAWNPYLVMLLILLAAWWSTGSLEKRGRMAGFLFPLFAICLLGGMVYSLKDASIKDCLGIFSGRPWDSGDALYTYFCVLGGCGLLSTGFSKIEKPRSAGSVLLGALGITTLTAGVFLIGCQIKFGAWRMQWENRPILLLFGGWKHVFFLGLLFTIGSLLFYGRRAMDLMGWGRASWALPAVMYLLNLDEGIVELLEQNFFWLLQRILFPVLVMAILLGFVKSVRRKEDKK